MKKWLDYSSTEVSTPEWLRAELPNLSDGQYAAMVAALPASSRVKDAASQIAFEMTKIISEKPALLQKVPTVSDAVSIRAHAYQQKMGKQAEPMLRMTWQREMQDWSADELLAACPGGPSAFKEVKCPHGVSPSSWAATTAADAATAPLPSGPSLATATVDELDAVLAQRFGHDDIHKFRAATWASNRMRLHSELRRQGAREEPTAPISESMKARGITKIDVKDEAFRKLTPAERISAHRRQQATEAAGSE